MSERSRPGRSPWCSRTSRGRPSFSKGWARTHTGTRSASIGGSCARHLRSTRATRSTTRATRSSTLSPRAAERSRRRARRCVGLEAGPIRVRVGIHTGEPLLDPPKYVGHGRAQGGADHGGRRTAGRCCSRRARSRCSAGASTLRDLGEHRLKDFDGAGARSSSSARSASRRSRRSRTRTCRVRRRSFVGREREVAEIVALLQDGARLVTLTGPGGIGQDAARDRGGGGARAASSRPASSGSVSLPLRDPALVLETIAQTLGAKDGLAEHIGERELLLLLDNLEQVVEAAPELAALARGLPEPAPARHEPGAAARPRRGRVPGAAARRARGGRALLRARAASSRATTVARALPRAWTTCRSRSSSPPRGRACSRPTQILERLSQRLDLLKGGRDADPRQQTLRATIEWSYDLLTAEEQQLFARLSVFAGGCTLEAAEEVCDADLDTLQSLVDKSLVRHTDERFWMLETIREYAVELLHQSHNEEEIRSRHVVFMEERYGELDRSDPAAWVPAVEADRDNLRAALRWAIDAHHVESGLVLANSYASLCIFHGPFAEARAWLVAAMDECAGAPPIARWRAFERGRGSGTSASRLRGGHGIRRGGSRTRTDDE